MIGIFDSGIGGLTVVKELFKQLPERRIVYFGDTARAPYGNKSQRLIKKYSQENIEFLLSQGAKIIIIACHTASALAADFLKIKYSNIPIFEVVKPTIKQALNWSQNRKIGLIGTYASVQSKIYENKIKQYNENVQVFSRACPLFVPLVEEGIINQPVTKIIARQYLRSLKTKQIDTLILGCTHYPFLKEIIQKKIGSRVKLIDPAEQIVKQLKQYLADNHTLEKKLANGKNHLFYFSDISPQLSDLAKKWLGYQISLKLSSFR